MNTQTELLENHTARLTVEVEPERLETAKQSAARKLSNRLNIPGFRKGKAPYRVILQYVGEGALIEDAVETLGNEIYKNLLEGSDLDPYGPGTIEDFNVPEGRPTFTFVVPLQPTIDLKDYRAIRQDYTPAKIEDRAVDDALRRLQEERAVVEESQRPAALGNRITAYIDGRLIENESEDTPAETDAEAVAAAIDDEEHHHVDNKTILHEHDAIITLEEDAVIPGFAEAVVGSNAGDIREFVLTYPDDPEEYEDMAGKRAHFTVQVKKVENVTLPALNDEFAARVTEDEEKPLTLLELRMRVRENLQQAAENRVNSDYARDVLNKMVENADIHYPEAMVQDQVERYLKQLDQDLRQRGITLDDYKRIYRKTDEDLQKEYQEPARRAIERALVMREVARAEALTVSPERLDEEIDRMAAQFGDQADNYRQLFGEPFMRESMANDLLSQATTERIAAIARGEAPDLEVASEAAVPADSAETETPAAPETDSAPGPEDEGDAAQS